jgi:hypothetical protein
MELLCTTVMGCNGLWLDLFFFGSVAIPKHALHTYTQAERRFPPEIFLESEQEHATLKRSSIMALTYVRTFFIFGGLNAYAPEVCDFFSVHTVHVIGACYCREQGDSWCGVHAT